MPKAPEHHQLQAAEYLAEDQLLSSNFSLDRSWCNPVGSEQVDPSQGLGQAYRTQREERYAHESPKLLRLQRPQTSNSMPSGY